MADAEPGALANIEERLEQFCGSSLWNSTLTGNSSFIDFTECFKHTVLIWMPCGFFWLALPFYLAYLCSGRSHIGRCSAMNITKFVLCLLAAVLSSAEVVCYLAWNIQTPMVYFASAIVSTATMLFAALLTLLYKRRGHMTSGILWCYWLLWLFSAFLMAYSMVKDAILMFSVDNDKLVPFVSTTSLFVVAFLQFILACCSDAAKVEAATSKKASPEHLSSFTSFLTFHWLGPLVALARRQRLQESDLVGLPPRDQLANHVPQFLEALQKAADAWTKRKLPAPADGTSKVHPDDTNERTPLLSTSKGKKGTKLSKTKPTVSKKINKGGKTQCCEDHLPLGGVIWLCYKKLVLAAFLWKLLHDLLKFADPLLQRLLIQFIASEGRGIWKGYIIAAGFVATQLLQTVFSQQVWHLSAMVGIQIRAALTAAVQKKALTMTNDAKKDFPSQEIFNLVNVDIPRIQEAVKYLWIVWSAPLLFGLALWQLYETIGVGAFAGLAFAAVTTPLIGQVASTQRRLQAKRALLKTERHRLTREAIGGIKVLKLHAWEPSFEDRIELVRKEEMVALRKIWCVRAVQMGLWALSSLAVTVVMFTVKAVWSPKYILLPEEAFVALSLLNIIKAPLNLLPIIVPYFCVAWTSMTRLILFFEEPDMEGDRVHHELLASAVSIQGGTFSWLSDAPPTLSSINLDISESSLAAIVGKPGSGKTSLLAACIGDMHRVSGSINVNGSVAYVGQTAWIQNGTVRDNIIFGKDYNESFYNHVVEACNLQPELLLLEHNDMTLVGETGVGLTASQKQLISLARAVYADADIYLIDNIFASIGVDVSQRIYDQVIGRKGLLKDKTRIVVVQGIHWLATVDSIAVMNNGGISEIGSYGKLASKDGPFMQYLKAYFLSDENTTTNNEIMDLQAEMLKHLVTVLGQREMQGVTRRDATSSSNRLAPPKQDMEASGRSYSSDVVAKGATAEDDSACQSWRWTSKITTAEQDDRPSALRGETMTALRLYFRAVGQGLCVVCLLLLLLYFTTMALADVWLCSWTSDRLLPNGTAPLDDKSKRLSLYIYVYGCLGAAQAAFIAAFCCLMAIGLTRASRSLHRGLLRSIMTATMAYIDTTPFALVFERFSKDIDTLDDSLGFITFQTLQTSLFMLTTVAVITYSIPVFPPLLVPVGILAYFIQVFFEPLTRQVSRLEAQAKQTVDAHFAELVSGLSVIRAYCYEGKYNDLLSQRVERHSVTHYVSWVASRWLALRLEVASAFVVAGTAVLAVLSLQYHLPVSASLAGIAITYALNAATSLQFIVRNNTDMKDRVVCVKKIKECIEIPRESRGITPSPPRSLLGRADALKETALHSGSIGNVSTNWPQNGVIELRHYSARHVSKEPLLDVQDVTLFIKSAEKVGVINRGGSPAATLVLPVFRLIEPLEGAIVIDGVDITRVDQRHLRKRLTVIAQDPVMFSGTLRYNLDPCSEYSDDLIWSALERARLKKLVLSLPGQLQYYCSDGGQNLSISQRRLLGVARALVRKTKVVFVLDDPPARDQATDAMVKKIIQREFSDCTVITVTQRLHSIMTCDRILIMDGGCIAEFDAPSVLQKKTSGAFYEMACGGM